MPETPEKLYTALHNFLSASEWFNFELTNYCNIPCIYCDNKNLGNKGYMTIDSFKVIVSKLFNGENKQKNVIFCGYGEPFLNSEIYDMIDYICDKGIELTIQTNGKWQLNETRIESLFKVHRLSVTIDAVTNDIFKLSRPNTDVDEIFKTLTKIVGLRERFSKATPIITAKMNVFSFNKHQTHDFIGKCTELKFDQICLAKGYGPAEVTTTLHRMEYDKYSNGTIDIAESLFDDASGNLSVRTQAGCNKFDGSGIEKVRPENIFQTLGCFDTATIKWDGRLLPCCWDTDCQLPLGNLVTDSLEDIFSLENLTRVGRKMVWDRNNPLSKIPCLRCSKFTAYFKPGFPVLAKRVILKHIFKVHKRLLNLWPR